MNLVYKTRVERTEKLGTGKYEVHIINPDGECFSYTTMFLINCAGLEADRIAATLGIDLRTHEYEQHFWKGEYFAIDQRLIVERCPEGVPFRDVIGGPGELA